MLIMINLSLELLRTSNNPKGSAEHNFIISNLRYHSITGYKYPSMCTHSLNIPHLYSDTKNGGYRSNSDILCTLICNFEIEWPQNIYKCFNRKYRRPKLKGLKWSLLKHSVYSVNYSRFWKVWMLPCSPETIHTYILLLFSYLQPSGWELNPPHTAEAMNWPPVMNMVFRVTKRPRTSGRALSAMYTGTLMLATPLQGNNKHAS